MLKIYHWSDTNEKRTDLRIVNVTRLAGSGAGFKLNGLNFAARLCRTKKIRAGIRMEGESV